MQARYTSIDRFEHLKQSGCGFAKIALWAFQTLDREGLDDHTDRSQFSSQKLRNTGAQTVDNSDLLRGYLRHFDERNFGTSLLVSGGHLGPVANYHDRVNTRFGLVEVPRVTVGPALLEAVPLGCVNQFHDALQSGLRRPSVAVDA
ncbi:hypothetical protein D3C77_638400 [compost metagenome]